MIHELYLRDRLTAFTDLVMQIITDDIESTDIMDELLAAPNFKFFYSESTLAGRR